MTEFKNLWDCLTCEWKILLLLNSCQSFKRKIILMLISRFIGSTGGMWEGKRGEETGTLSKKSGGRGQFLGIFIWRKLSTISTKNFSSSFSLGWRLKCYFWLVYTIEVGMGLLLFRSLLSKNVPLFALILFNPEAYKTYKNTQKNFQIYVFCSV